MVRKLLLVVVLLLFFSIAVMPVFAVSGGQLTGATFDCSKIDVAYGAVTFDRDNTGFGYELYRVQVTDGDGTILFDRLNALSVGSVIGAHDSEYIDYAVAPNYNPIRLRFYSLSGNGFAEQYIWDIQGECAGLPYTNAAGPGPARPSNFVMRTITCDTPVYNVPSGNPVGAGRVTMGQTWFVNPTPITSPVDGTSWTEIFVQSNPNPFIPTTCVR
ncbi:MAG: hypothetical protein IAE80_03875 [Anaerolinea sp.]|nr:hypothetical protein [Anaerolinea sp.]